MVLLFQKEEELKSPHCDYRKDRSIEIDLGAEKIKVTEWEKKAIILVAEGFNQQEVAKRLGMNPKATTPHMRLYRLKFRLAPSVGMIGNLSTTESVLCKVAFKGRLVRL